jgi:hypothetical protein
MILVPCNTDVAMSITFGGTEFTISPDTFKIGPSDPDSNSQCVGALSAQDGLGERIAWPYSKQTLTPNRILGSW